MGIKRLTRVNELLKREVADVLGRVMAEDIADRPMITVTRVDTSPDLRRAHVFLSVLGPAAAGAEALSAVYQQRKEIQRLVNKHLTLKYTPRLSFRLDDSLQQGDRVLALLEELDTPDDPDETADDAPSRQDAPEA